MKAKKLAVLFLVYVLTISLDVVLSAPANADEQEIDSDLRLAAARLNELMTEDKTSTVQNRHITQNTNTVEDGDMNDALSYDQHEVDGFKHSLRKFQAALLTNGMRKAFMHKLVQATTDEDLERLKRSNRRKTNRFKRSASWWGWGGCPTCDTTKVIESVPCCDKPKDDNELSPSL